MSQLTEELRILIEDEGSIYDIDFTDDELTKYLNKYRGYLEDYPLSPENYYTWISPFKYLDNRSLSDGTAEISEDEYTADDINGIYQFAEEQSAVYITANYYDLYKTASEIWLVRAARAKFSGKTQLGDEVIPMDKYNREYCIQKYWDLSLSESIQMERE